MKENKKYKPIVVDLIKGKTYVWCTCRQSENQPWCDGTHKKLDLSPMIFVANKDEKAAMCLCKKTKTPPFCDGSHND